MNSVSSMPALPVESKTKKSKPVSKKRRRSEKKCRFILSEAEESGSDAGGDKGGEEEEDATDDEEKAQKELDEAMINDESSEDETKRLPKLTRKEKRRLSKGDREVAKDALEFLSRSAEKREKPQSPCQWESSNSEYDSDFVEKTEEDREAEALARKTRQARRGLGVFCKGDPTSGNRGKTCVILNTSEKSSLYLLDPTSGSLKDASTGEAVTPAAKNSAVILASSARKAAEEKKAYEDTLEYLRGRRRFNEAEKASWNSEPCPEQPSASKRSKTDKVSSSSCVYSGAPTPKPAAVFNTGHVFAPAKTKDSAKMPQKAGVFRDSASGNLYYRHKDGRLSPRQ